MSTSVGGGRVLLHLVVKLLVVFAVAVGIASGLCVLLVRRVRAHDAALGLATSKLDALSLRSLSSLQELQRSHETFLHVFAVQFPLALACFACIYVLKQTFAIPGSALLNVFAGAVLPLSLAFPLVCTLTACGASCCFLLSRSLASEEIVLSVSERLLPGKLRALRQKIEDARERGQLPFLLLFLRVFPFTPNWFLNMASPWLQVPLKLFAPSVAIGLLPYNFVTVHAGAMLSSLRSTSDLLDPRTMGMLIVLAIGMLIPALLKKKAKSRETESNEQSVPQSSKKTD
ncbi:Transmembrane protein 41A [Phytophthora boehmeriae]|uniref:Transmembrane protein 41A n=1 Tax=Phytophthora boehmeriae TaxID=109152 RepID=A0A8T1X2Q6_9STRA|nr:Transmembrane protein 41A [Phytophthora boehmeriae]